MALKAEFPGLELHLIGPLQSNKTREAMALFDVIQTLDRARLAGCAGRRTRQDGPMPQAFRAGEHGRRTAKGGCTAERGRRVDCLCPQARSSRHRPDVHSAGGRRCLRPHFAFLAKLAMDNRPFDRSQHGYEQRFSKMAVRFGATYVRVGSAIFGERSDIGCLTPCPPLGERGAAAFVGPRDLVTCFAGSSSPLDPYLVPRLRNCSSAAVQIVLQPAPRSRPSAE